MMDMHSRLDQSFCQAKLAQASAFLQHRSTTCPPLSRSIEAFYVCIMMHQDPPRLCCATLIAGRSKQTGFSP
jgi:hypothetical protein